MTDLDLDKIKRTLTEYERAKVNGAARRHDTRAQYNQWFSAHIVDLIAEVERLRAIVDDQAQRIHTLENY